METVQTNVRVAESDKPLIIQIAARLRADAEFRARLTALLEEQAGAALAERVKTLEQQVSWLLSGAIVVPRSGTRAVQPPPTAVPRFPNKVPPVRAGDGHD